MGVLTSMSDIRTKLLLGTSIGALAMIFVMAVGVDAFNTESTIAVQSGTLNGHATVMAIHPDGSISYVQTDNIIVDAGVDVAIDNLFDATAAAAATPFDCIEMGSGAGTSTTALDAALGAAGPICSGAATNPVAAPNAAVDIVSVFPALVAADMTDGGQTTVTITEVVLENSSGVIISHVELTTDIGAVVGTIVTITYTMTLT